MPSAKERVVIISAIASGTLAAAKLGVGLVIGSLALVSDALHSTIDLGATLVTWYAVRVAERPPDAEHHYGHGKAESIAALAETALLFLLAGGVAVEAVSRLQTGGTPVSFSAIPFVVLAIEMIVNAWRARALLKAAHETRSHALAADALHFASDFFGSIPVMIGLALSAYGYAWGDPAAALVVAALIAVLGFRLARRNVEALVDTAPTGVAEKVEDAILSIPGIVAVERVRVRDVGARHFVDVSIAVPRTYPLDRSEQVKHSITNAVGKILGDADVTVSATPTALDDETVTERIMVIARNRGLAIHHVTVHRIAGRLTLSIDLEVNGALTLTEAHDIASGLEDAIADEFGAEIEIDTHIEPLQIDDVAGRDAPAERAAAMQQVLAETAASFGVLRNIHDVRVRDTESGEIVNFHCHVDPKLTVAEVHDRVDEVERGLRRRFPGLKRVIGHAEPAP